MQVFIKNYIENNMKLYFIISVFILTVVFTKAEYNNDSATTYLSDTALVCPVTGDPISGEHIAFRYVDKELKFCNDGCLMAYKKDPAKYSEHLKCMPCNDDDANREISTTHDGVKYYFCGKGCKGKFEKDPESYLKKFSEQD